MTLGNLLANIADTEGNTQEQLKAEFIERVKGHKEENLLMYCLQVACTGKKSIILNKCILPPQELQEEGFNLIPDACGKNRYCFE